MTIHPDGDKMYKDMKRMFYWSGMKKDVAEFVAKCLVCQRVKAEQQRPVDCFNQWMYSNGNGIVFRWTS